MLYSARMFGMLSAYELFTRRNQIPRSLFLIINIIMTSTHFPFIGSVWVFLSVGTVRRDGIHVKIAPCHHDVTRSPVADEGGGLQIWRIAANILKSSCGRLIRGGPAAWGFGKGLTSPHLKKRIVMKCYTGHRNWTNSLERSRQWKNKASGT